LYWLLFNLVTFYIMFVIDLDIKRINSSAALIVRQKEALNAVNQNLEQLVSDRTAALEEQNEKLKQHAYFNAHLLRGPFCRIQGLVGLQNLQDWDVGEKSEIRVRLQESIQELDTRIREIQKLVETDDREKTTLDNNTKQPAPSNSGS
jgi:Tfp pilus assembly protein PilN